MPSRSTTAEIAFSTCPGAISADASCPPALRMALASSRPAQVGVLASHGQEPYVEARKQRRSRNMIDRPYRARSPIISDENLLYRPEGACRDNDRLASRTRDALQIGAQMQFGEIRRLPALAYDDAARTRLGCRDLLRKIAMAKPCRHVLYPSIAEDFFRIFEDGTAALLCQLRPLFVEARKFFQ